MFFSAIELRFPPQFLLGAPPTLCRNAPVTQRTHTFQIHIALRTAGRQHHIQETAHGLADGISCRTRRCPSLLPPPPEMTLSRAPSASVRPPMPSNRCVTPGTAPEPASDGDTGGPGVPPRAPRRMTRTPPPQAPPTCAKSTWALPPTSALVGVGDCLGGCETRQPVVGPRSYWRGKGAQAVGRDVLEGGKGAGVKGRGGGFGWDPPPPRVPLWSPPKAGRKILKLTSSWHRRHRSRILAVSLKHWKGRKGGGVWGGGLTPHPPAVYGRSNTSLASGPTFAPPPPCLHTSSRSAHSADQFDGPCDIL